ncbi:MAG: hypothetical protein IPG69_21120 [Flavobacteriales bacterium]|nr:hypothetical protein [Flavobacteriales bacterium]
MEIQRTLRLRAYLVYGLLIVFALTIAVKLFTIQLVEGDKWVARSEHVATAYRTVQPDRGHIYSEDGRFLSTSVPSMKCAWTSWPTASAMSCSAPSSIRFVRP